MELQGTGTHEGTLVPVTGGQIAVLSKLAEQAGAFMAQAKAPNTLRAYRTDWQDFQTWCKQHEMEALPATPGTVGLYLSSLAETHKVATIERRVSAISQAHQMAGHESPTADVAVRTLLAGVRRAKGTAQAGKLPVLTEHVWVMLTKLPDNLLGLRDRALLLIGFSGGFRRSKLVGLDAGDVEFTGEGLVVMIRRSKTDQEAQGRPVGIPRGAHPETCPARAVRVWLSASSISEGPLFRSVNRHGQLQPGRLTDRTVARVVQRSALAAGLDPSRFAGHSLRARVATQAAMGGVSERSIMLQTGDRSVAVMRRYIRLGSLFTENAAARIGL